jgi:TfdA family taurine catabolism dioxygenase TauD
MLSTQNVSPTSFSQPPKPVAVDRWDVPDADTVRTMVTRYTATGFAVIEGPPNPGRADLMTLAQRLRLGEPFAPPIYQGSSHTGTDGVSALTAAEVEAATHPFQSREGQNLHCDGTLQELGQIPTTLMICVRPAASGGATILFDALAAFAELFHHDRAAADQLTHPRALRRTSDIGGGRSTVGPVFGWHAGRIVTRYSLRPTDTYHPLHPDQQPALDRALRFLEQAAQPGSPYRCEFTLQAGHALVLANDLVCHGRTAYQDEPGAKRELLRALFTRRPTVPGQDDIR